MIQTRGVLAGAYRARRHLDDRSLLTHAFDTERGISLCGNIDEGNVVDEYGYTDGELQGRATCPLCLKRDARFGGRYRRRAR